MKKIILTGGGSAGHVVGNIALIPKLLEKNYEIKYIGSLNGIEKGMIEKLNIPYFPISTGKIHRYLTAKNLSQPFKVIKGITDAYKILKREKPDVIFSKGGFVSVPVAIASKLLKIPFVGHESDLSMGLANKVALRFTDKILVTFPETLESTKGKGILVGSPIREELLTGDRQRGLEFLGFKNDKPLLLIMGGSLGSKYINKTVDKNLNKLTELFNICHLRGKNNLNNDLNNVIGYRQFEFLTEEIKDILHAADYVVSRSGSNAIFEFLKLRIPSLLVPLDVDQSRGDQVENAMSFTKAGYSLMIRERDITDETFLNKVLELKDNGDVLKENMKNAHFPDALNKIVSVIEEISKK